VAKIVAFEEERLVHHLGQGIRKAVAEIQTRAMTAASAKITVGFTCNLRLLCGHRFDQDSCFPNKKVELAA